MDEEEQIAEVIHLSFESIEIGIKHVEEGLENKDKNLVKAGFHLMRPNLVHIELAEFAEKFPDAEQADFFERAQELIAHLAPKIKEVKTNNIIP